MPSVVAVPVYGLDDVEFANLVKLLPEVVTSLVRLEPRDESAVLEYP